MLATRKDKKGDKEKTKSFSDVVNDIMNGNNFNEEGQIIDVPENDQ